MDCKITIDYSGRKFDIYAKEGDILLGVLHKEGTPIVAPCGGKGLCGKCRVKVQSDKPLELTPEELDYFTEAEVAAGFRLACRTRVTDGLTVFVDKKDLIARIMTDGADIDMQVYNDIERKRVKVPSGTVDDQSADIARLKKELGDIDIPFNLYNKLPKELYVNDGSVTCLVHQGSLLDITAGDDKPMYGVSIDLGTTTIAAYLLNLDNGKIMQVSSALNPQKPFGDDVITRCDYIINNEDGLVTLQGKIVDCINDLAAGMVDKQGITLQDIYKMNIVGNTVMMHILAGVDPKNIAVLPFIPVFDKLQVLKCGDIGLKAHNNAVLNILPTIASYVGADTIAAIMACGMDRNSKNTLLIDIGTNGEIVLGNRDKMVSCSTAAGPAFEGAHIKHGMGGVTGAINRIDYIEQEFTFGTIDSADPLGICGSALIDVIALLKQTGALDETGLLSDVGELTEFIAEGDRGYDFILHKESGISVCQGDIREVQLAKGAIAAGIDILISELGITVNDIDEVYLAGGFGSYINPNNACDIGLLPLELKGKVAAIGNAAGTGAKMSMLSISELNRSKSIKEQVDYIELSMRLDFQMLFVDKMMF